MKKYRPVAATVALLAMLLAAGILMIRFFQAIATVLLSAEALPAAIVTTILMVGVGVFAVAVPVVALWALRTGRRWAPLVVTIVGIWACTELLTYADFLAFFSAGTSIVGGVAAWTPSARAYGRALRGSVKNGFDIEGGT